MPTIIIASALIIFGSTQVNASKPVTAPTCHVEVLAAGPAMARGWSMQYVHPSTVKVCR